MLFHPYPNAFGLDISDRAIAIVDLKNISRRKRSPQFHLDIFRHIALPPGLIVNGELFAPEKVRTHIKQLMEGKKNEHPVVGKWVVASLPETQSFLKVLHVSQEQQGITGDVVYALAEKHIPFDKETYYLDWQTLPAISSESKTIRLLIGATPKPIADSYTYLIESLGLGIIALEIESLALARSLITVHKEYTNEARALLHIGDTYTSLIIHDHDAIQFSNIIQFSSSLLQTQLVEMLHISESEATTLLETHGVSYTKKYGKAFTPMTQRIDICVHAIEKSFQFYYTHFPHTNTITHITMSGSGSALLQLPEILSKKLGISCLPGNVWKNLGDAPGTLPDTRSSLTYATAIGLALRASDNPYRQYDMM